MYGQDRRQMRQQFIDAWAKAQNRQPLMPLEAMIVDAIAEHPEYHALMSDPERALEQDWHPEQGETNPFLHLSMHLSIREMVQTDQPRGMRAAFDTVAKALGDPLEAEHRIMDCLGEVLWRAQRDNQPPDEQALLTCITALVRR